MSLYQTLGVRNGANPIEIQAAYKALEEAHKTSDIETQLEIALAYQTLIHPSRRAEYDSGFNAEIPALMDVPRQEYLQSEHIRVVSHYHHYQSQHEEIHPFQKVVVCFIMGMVGTLFLFAICLTV